MYKVGDFVWLSLKNFKPTRPCKKLDWKNAKFKVTKKISALVYELDVPPGIYNRFHVSLLRPAATDPFPSQPTDDTRPPPLFVEDGGEENWEVEEIIRTRGDKRKQVLVKWTGYAKPTWEPLGNVQHTVAYRQYKVKAGKTKKQGG